MATIKQFEDLLSWQKATELTGLIYRVSGEGEFAKDFALRDQIRRAVISIGANIAEGFHRRGDSEFHHFLTIAKGSTGEVRALAYSAEAAGLLKLDALEKIVEQSKACEQLIEGMMRYLKKAGKRKRKAASGSS